MESFQEKDHFKFFPNIMCLQDLMSCAKKRYKLNSMNVFALSYLQII